MILLPMTWSAKKAEHHKPWYWPVFSWIFGVNNVANDSDASQSFLGQCLTPSHYFVCLIQTSLNKTKIESQFRNFAELRCHIAVAVGVPTLFSFFEENTDQSCAMSLYVFQRHYDDVIMTTIASQITSLTVVYSTVKSKKTSKLRVTGLCEGNSPGPVNSPHKGPVTRKMFPFDDVIMVAKQF